MCRRRERQEEAPLGCRYLVEPQANVPTAPGYANPYITMYEGARRHAQIRQRVLSSNPEAVFDRTLNRRIDNYLRGRDAGNYRDNISEYMANFISRNPPRRAGDTLERAYVKRNFGFFLIIVLALIMLAVVVFPHILPANSGLRRGLTPYTVAYMNEYVYSPSEEATENAVYSYAGRTYAISSVKAYSVVFLGDNATVLGAEDSEHRVYGSGQLELDETLLRYRFDGDEEFSEQYIIDTVGGRIFTPQYYYPSAIDMIVGMFSGPSQKEDALPADNAGTLFHTAINGATATDGENSTVTTKIAGYIIPISFLLLAVFAIYIIAKAILGLATEGRRHWFIIAVLLGIVLITAIFGIALLGDAVNCGDGVDISMRTALTRSGWAVAVVFALITVSVLITVPFLYKAINAFEDFDLKIKYMDGEFPYRKVVANKIKVRKEYEYEKESENPVPNPVEHNGCPGRIDVAVSGSIPLRCPVSDARRF